MNKEFTEFHDLLKIDCELELTETLFNHEVLSEAQYMGMENKYSINDELLNEAEKIQDPNVYSPDREGGNISFEFFKSLYQNPEKYPNALEVGKQLYPAQKPPSDTAAKRKYNRVLNYFRENNPEGKRELASPRSQFLPDVEDDGGGEELSVKDRIHAGRRGQRSATGNIEQINDNDIFPGELYTDRSRIPPRRWEAWYKIWQRKTSVSRNPRKGLARAGKNDGVLGKEWMKFFILGYELPNELRFEIWYNSLDSTFAVHDKNGNRIQEQQRTFRDALKVFFKQVAQMSDEDLDVFSGGDVSFSAITNMLKQEKERQKSGIEQKEKQILKKQRSKQDRQRGSNTTKEKVPGGSEMDMDVSYQHQDQDQDDKNFKEKQGKQQRDKESMKSKNKKDSKKRNKKATDDVSVSDDDNTTMDSEKIRKEVDRRKADIAGQAEVDKARKNKGNGGKENEDQDTKGKPYKSSQDVMDDIPDFKRDGNDGAATNEAVNFEENDDNLIIRVFETNDFVCEDYAIEENIDYSDAEENPLYDRESDLKVKQAKQAAHRTSFTTGEFADAIMSGMVEQYDKTRIKNPDNVIVRSLKRFSKFFRGRAEKVSNPTDFMTNWARIAGGFYGVQSRADFIIGFTLGDKANFEVWYVQELDKSQGERRQAASFYVYDVSAQKAIAYRIPYYRNALQVIAEKIGVPQEEQ